MCMCVHVYEQKWTIQFMMTQIAILILTIVI